MQSRQTRRRWVVSLPTFFITALLAAGAGTAGGIVITRRFMPIPPPQVTLIAPPPTYGTDPNSPNYGLTAPPAGWSAPPAVSPAMVQLAPCGHPWATGDDQVYGVMTAPEQVCVRGHKFVKEQGTWVPENEDNRPTVAVPLTRMQAHQRVVPYQ